jgi:hypothetical protein
MSLVLAACSVCVACGEAPGDPPPGRAATAVIEGTPSPREQDAVVAIMDRQRFWFTGVLVAPTLVLTVRHGVLRQSPPDEAEIACPDDLVGSPVDSVRDASEFTVQIGHQLPFEGLAHGKRLFTGSSLDLCEDDVVLLELDASLEIEPLPLRLDEPTLAHEAGTLIGWGKTEEGLANPNGSRTLHGTRRQLQQRIEAVGPHDLRLPQGGVLKVSESMFVTEQGGCYGDSGGPFVADATGAVIGLFSTIQPSTVEPSSDQSVTDCVGAYSVFRRLAARQYRWLRAAFEAAGQAPWYEGLRRPGELGAPCDVAEECSSRSCLRVSGRGFCSGPCRDAACPEDMQCVSLPEQSPAESPACVPARLGSPAPADSGCSLAQRRGSDSPWLRLAVFAGFWSLRRASWRRAASRKET